MMINKLNKKAKMKKILLFLFCFSAHTNLYVLFSHALKIMEWDFMRKFLQKRFSYIVYPPFNFSSPYF